MIWWGLQFCLFCAGSKAVEVFNVIWYTLNAINQYLNNKGTTMHAEVIMFKFSSCLYRCC